MKDKKQKRHYVVGRISQVEGRRFLNEQKGGCGTSVEAPEYKPASETLGKSRYSQKKSD